MHVVMVKLRTGYYSALYRSAILFLLIWGQPEAVWPQETVLRARTAEPAPLEGCPQGSPADADNGAYVDILVKAELAPPSSVKITLHVTMEEREGDGARGELSVSEETTIPDFPPSCRVTGIAQRKEMRCHFFRRAHGRADSQCEFDESKSFVRSVEVTVNSVGNDFDCIGSPHEDAYVKASFRPITVEYVCSQE
jgi:hypothetical protein